MDARRRGGGGSAFVRNVTLACSVVMQNLEQGRAFRKRRGDQTRPKKTNKKKQNRERDGSAVTWPTKRTG